MRKTTASSLIQRGRPAEHHLLPKKLLIKSQLSFCKHFTENKICKLISCESSPGVKGRREGGREGEPAGRRAALLTLAGEALLPPPRPCFRNEATLASARSDKQNNGKSNTAVILRLLTAGYQNTPERTPPRRPGQIILLIPPFFAQDLEKFNSR